MPDPAHGKKKRTVPKTTPSSRNGIQNLYAKYALEQRMKEQRERLVAGAARQRDVISANRGEEVVERYKQSSIAAALNEKRRRLEELERIQNDKEKERRERLAAIYERHGNSNSKLKKRAAPAHAPPPAPMSYESNSRPSSQKKLDPLRRLPESRERPIGSRGYSGIPDRPPIKPILAPRVAVIGNERRDLISMPPPPLSRGLQSGQSSSAIKSPYAVRNRMKENYEHVDPLKHGFDVRSQQQLDRRAAAVAMGGLPSEPQLRQEYKRNPASGRQVVQEVYKPPSSQRKYEAARPSWWG